LYRFAQLWIKGGRGKEFSPCEVTDEGGQEGGSPIGSEATPQLGKTIVTTNYVKDISKEVSFFYLFAIACR